MSEGFQDEFEVADVFLLLGNGVLPLDSGKGDDGIDLEQRELVFQPGLAGFEVGLGLERLMVTVVLVSGPITQVVVGFVTV